MTKRVLCLSVHGWFPCGTRWSAPTELSANLVVSKKVVNGSKTGIGFTHGHTYQAHLLGCAIALTRVVVTRHFRTSWYSNINDGHTKIHLPEHILRVNEIDYTNVKQQAEEFIAVSRFSYPKSSIQDRI